MKLFICALVVLALIASFCVFGAVACAAIIDEMVDLLDTAAPQGGDVIPPQADTVSGALLEKWNEHFFCISMFLPHHHLDDVKVTMVTLDSYAQTDCMQMRTIFYRKRKIASFFAFSLDLP